MNLENKDLAVVPLEERTWTAGNFAALWISLSLCIPTYMLASSLIEGGMDWKQALFTIFLGNAIVAVPMVLAGRVGADYGIPFPVFARASFGVRGANVPALLRAVVACGWFGIQTWIGGYALFQVVRVWWPGFGELPHVLPTWVGLETGPAMTFLAFWFANMLCVRRGIEGIRRLLVFKSFFLPLAAAMLLFWAIDAASGLGPLLARPSSFETPAQFWAYFVPALTGIVGFWATISLNIPDFTRYAESPRAQAVGQMLSLPPAMTVFAFVGILVTSATTLVFGETVWDPVELAGRFDSKLLVTFAMIAVATATLATNIAANVVSPANDFANVSPSRVDFRLGGYITGVIGLVILPWKLVADPSGYIFTWLVAYSSLLGPIGGILLADYYLVRGQRLEVTELYRADGRYGYANGVHWRAIFALALGVLPNVPGFLVQIGAVPAAEFPSWVSELYHFAWFVGFFVSGILYTLVTKGRVRV